MQIGLFLIAGVLYLSEVGWVPPWQGSSTPSGSLPLDYSFTQAWILFVQIQDRIVGVVVEVFGFLVFQSSGQCKRVAYSQLQ